MKAKYAPLEEHLCQKIHEKLQVTMTFYEIEKILGAQLPVSAYKYREWWSNQSDTSNRPHAKAWTAAGYEVDDVQQQRDHGTVCFRRRGK